MRSNYSKDELHKLEEDYKIPLTYQVDLIEPGWRGKPKGLLHVLWEQGWIAPNKLGLYLKKRKSKPIRL